MSSNTTLRGTQAQARGDSGAINDSFTRTTEDLLNLQSSSSSSAVSPFIVGIVEDVISNPYSFLEKIENINDITNPSVSPYQNYQVVKLIPPNSIVAKVIGKGNEQITKSILCFPFFSSHLMMPIKPGETVWILKHSENLFYWITRQSSYRQIEDVNYTFNQREINVSEIESSEDPAIFTHFKFKDDILSFAKIKQRSVAYNEEFTGEPVPRLSKDCGDFLIQGSNNSHIYLGKEKFELPGETIDTQDFVFDKEDINNFRKPVSPAIDLCVLRKSDQILELKKKVSQLQKRSQEEIQEEISITSGFKSIDDPKHYEIQKDRDKIKKEILFDEFQDTEIYNCAARTYLSNSKTIDEILNCPNYSGEPELSSSPQDLSGNDDYGVFAALGTNTRIIGKETIKIHNASGLSGIQFTPNGDVIIFANTEGGAKIVLEAGGDIRIVPGENGILKLGSDNAVGGIVASAESTRSLGSIESTSIVTTAGGIVAAPNVPATGKFSNKVLIAVDLIWFGAKVAFEGTLKTFGDEEVWKVKYQQEVVNVLESGGAEIFGIPIPLSLPTPQLAQSQALSFKEKIDKGEEPLPIMTDGILGTLQTIDTILPPGPNNPIGFQDPTFPIKDIIPEFSKILIDIGITDPTTWIIEHLEEVAALPWDEFSKCENENFSKKMKEIDPNIDADSLKNKLENVCGFSIPKINISFPPKIEFPVLNFDFALNFDLPTFDPFINFDPEFPSINWIPIQITIGIFDLIKKLIAMIGELILSLIKGIIEFIKFIIELAIKIILIAIEAILAVLGQSILLIASIVAYIKITISAFVTAFVGFLVNSGIIVLYSGEKMGLWLNIWQYFLIVNNYIEEIMASFVFKSSGTKIEDRNVSSNKVTKKLRDLGIKTPLTNFQGHQIFDMHQDPTDQIKDNLKNLLLTNFGERLGLYDFGSDLNALVFEFVNNPSVETEMTERIQSAVQKYMPGIEITDISQIDVDKNEKEIANRQGLAIIRLRIVYDIPNARIGNQAIEVSLRGGG